MSAGPSPLIPFLMVIILWLIIYGRSLINSFSLVQQTSFDFLVVIPLLSILFIYFSSQSILVPLMLVLVMYMVSVTLFGPLILLFVIYFLSVYWPIINRGRDRGGGRGCNYEGYGNVGWGSVWFFMLFLILQGLFCDGEGYNWFISFLIALIFILYNLLG